MNGSVRSPVASIDTLTAQTLTLFFLTGQSFDTAMPQLEDHITALEKQQGRPCSREEKADLMRRLGCYVFNNNLILNMAPGINLAVSRPASRTSWIRPRTSSRGRGPSTWVTCIEIYALAPRTVLFSKKSYSENSPTGVKVSLGICEHRKFFYDDISKTITSLTAIRMIGERVQRQFGDNPFLVKKVVREGTNYQFELSDSLIGVVTTFPGFWNHKADVGAFRARRYFEFCMALLIVARKWSKQALALAIFFQTERGNPKLNHGTKK